MLFDGRGEFLTRSMVGAFYNISTYILLAVPMWRYVAT
jgi:hypothetical protein